MALDAGLIDLRAPIKVRLPGSVVPGPKDAALPEDHEPGTPWIADTTLGRVLFNELLPTGYPFVNDELPKKRQAADRQRPGRALPDVRRSRRPWTGSRKPASTGPPARA